MNRKRLFFLLILFYQTFAFAQTKQVQNLVFEGAGIRGIAYAGAITQLESAQLLHGVKRVGGTSAGAITALMLSLGYTAQEITALVGQTDFKKLNDGNLFFAGGIRRMRKAFGWYRGNKANQWLGEIIKAKTGNAATTFIELKQMDFKDLYVTGTSLSRQQLILFSHEHYPRMQVKDAVRISMSIPFYFEAVFIDSTGTIINKPQEGQKLDVMVDGGFTGNFPIRLFDSTKYISPDGDNVFKPNPYTLGFRIDRTEQIQHDGNGKGLAPMPVTNLKEYGIAFYTMILENLNRQTLTPADWSRTVSISDGALSPRIRRLSAAEINLLITNGSKAVMRYLHQE
jgi:NTE family protein